MRRGSWPVLLALAAAFLVLFAVQRHRSTFLRIEAERPAAVELARETGLGVADVFALRDLVGADAAAVAWRDAALAFARLRGELGDALAVVAVAGDAAAARRARAAAPDADRAWEQFRVEPAALPGLRFLALRERFAARAAARD